MIIFQQLTFWLLRSIATAQAYYWKAVGGVDPCQDDFTESLVACAAFCTGGRYGDVAVHHPVALMCQVGLELYDHELSIRLGNHNFTLQPRFEVLEGHLPALLPIWFTHSTLLKNTVNAPYRTATALQSQIVIILRAEFGFMPETSGVAGMDERADLGYRPSVVDLRLELLRRLPHGTQEPAILKDILGEEREEEQTQSSKGAEKRPEAVAYANRFAYSMLRLSLQPLKNIGLLLV